MLENKIRLLETQKNEDNNKLLNLINQRRLNFSYNNYNKFKKDNNNFYNMNNINNINNITKNKKKKTKKKDENIIKRLFQIV